MSDTQLKYVYVVEVTQFGSFGLARAVIEKETANSYFIRAASEEQLIGWAYVGRRFDKANPNVFTAGRDAVKALDENLVKVRAQTEGRLQRIDAARKKIAALNPTAVAEGEGEG